MAAQTATCTLRLVRPAQPYADLIRSYKIYVDDMMVGKIARKSMLELDISSGVHVVRAEIDWGRAQPLAINAVPGQVIEIEVANHWGALLAIWAITFGASTYLTMRRHSLPPLARLRCRSLKTRRSSA